MSRRPLLALVVLLALTSSAHAAPNCQDLLVGSSYQCSATFEDFSTLQFPLTFSAAKPSPNTVSLKFDADDTGVVYGCTCNPSGSAKKPKFNVSRSFVCVAPDGVFSISLSGKVNGTGTKISNGVFAQTSGSSGVFACSRVP